jgi:choline monooxygenase
MVSPRISKKPLINADLRSAETLPTSFYKEQKYFDLAREKIFAKTWQLSLSAHALKEHKAVPVTLLPGMLDEPLLFTKIGDSINCFSNVCTHRGNVLTTSACNPQQLRCGYHGRCFDLGGNFVSTPGFDQALNFPAERDNLSRVPIGFFENFIFSSLDPAYPFEELVQDMRSRIGWLPINDFEFAPELSRDYEVRANWLLYAENFLEGFHIPFVHPGLASTLDIRDYRAERYPNSNLQIGVAAAGEQCFDLPKDSPEYGDHISAYYYYLFPNTIFDFYPWGLSINILEPMAVNHTKIRFLTYVWDRAKLHPSVMDLLHITELEDEAIVEQVAQGIKSRFYKRGRYSPQWEENVHHFQRLVANALDFEDV